MDKPDISSLADIKVLVNAFYGEVRQDRLIGPIFDDVIKDNWPRHLDIMYRFWQTILLEEHTYNGAPFAPHLKLPVDEKHFERWLNLFYQTVDGLFEGPVAKEAKWRAEKMAGMFMHKLDFYRKNDLHPLI